MACCSAALWMGAASGSPTVPSGAIDDAGECTDAVPAAYSIAGVLDHGRDVVLQVHVLLDEIPASRGLEVMSQAQQAYDEIGITLKPTFQQVSFPPQTVGLDGPTDTEAGPVSDRDYLFERSKAAVDGVRPPGADVVYLMTNDEILGAAGVADCIGGVRYPDAAFAIGEVEPDEPPQSIEICCNFTAAKVAAHEIAHLLGAHHHYANCAEGALGLADGGIETCTLMFNDAGLINLDLSTLEGAVMRGHAVAYADAPAASAPPASPPPSASPTPAPTQQPSKPTPTPAPTATPAPSATPGPSASPEPTAAPEPLTYARAVTLRLGKHVVARGRVDAGAATSCTESASVLLQRRRAGEWETVDAVTTSAAGRFRVRLPDVPGRYRALAEESTFSDDDQTYVCGIAASSPARHSHR